MKIVPNVLYAVTFQLSLLDIKNYIVKNVTYEEALKYRENRARRMERLVDDYKIEMMNNEIDNLRCIHD